MGTCSAPTPTPATRETRGRVVAGIGDPTRDALVLAFAREEAATTGARLTICRAGHPPAGWPTMDGLMLVDPVFARAVRDVRQRLGGDRVDIWLDDGTPHAVLAAASVGADLIVVGPPTRHGSPSPRIAAAADSTGDFWFDEDTLETHFRVQPPQLNLMAGVVEPVRSRHPGVPLRLCVLVGTPVHRLRDAARAAVLTVVGRPRHPVRPLSGRLSADLVRTAFGPLAVVPAGYGER